MPAGAPVPPAFTAGRLVPPLPGEPQDQWWQRNLGKAVFGNYRPSRLLER